MQDMPSGEPSVPPPPTSYDVARDKLNVPSIILIILGILGALGAAVFTVVAILQAMGIVEGTKNPVGSVGAAGCFFIAILASLFVIFAAVRMRQLRAYPLAIAGAIVALIPCLGPCCILGIPFGIWCLIVLLKPEVKAGFQSRA